MHAELIALFQVLLIDLTLAGDNVVVVGLAVNGLPRHQQRRAILAGIALATVIRIGFSLVALRMLAVIGLSLAGGILLLWVSWKMFRELSAAKHQEPGTGAPAKVKTLAQAVTQIALADISMSLDNVLAVAGAAHAHPRVLFLGLGLSVALMGVAASLVARVLERWQFLAWAGLATVFYVSIKMIIDGFAQVASLL